MTDREKLIESLYQWNIQQYIPFHTEIAMLADYLIANGVTVQRKNEIDFDYGAED